MPDKYTVDGFKEWLISEQGRKKLSYWADVLSKTSLMSIVAKDSEVMNAEKAYWLAKQYREYIKEKEFYSRIDKHFDRWNKESDNV